MNRLVFASFAAALVIAAPLANAARAPAEDALTFRPAPTLNANAEDHSVKMAARKKKRVKGASGCDDPRDAIEHPECR
jgi:hypothetical protein